MVSKIKLPLFFSTSILFYGWMDNSENILNQDYRVTAIQIWMLYDITELSVKILILNPRWIFWWRASVKLENMESDFSL